MTPYSFRDSLNYFSDKLHAMPSEEDIEAGEVELVIDQQHVIFSQRSIEGGLNMTLALGLILQPLREARLKELVTSNYLGVNTGGCTFSFDETGVSLQLQVNTTPSSSPQENWEWLHRLLHMGKEWTKRFVLWEEFILLNGEER